MAVTYVDFLDGTSQRARVKFINPKAMPITYEGKFYLAVASALTVPVSTPVVTSFTVAALGTLDVDFSVPIPLLSVQTANFVACVQVSVAGTPIVTFVNLERIVRVTFSPAISWGDIVWNP